MRTKTPNKYPFLAIFLLLNKNLRTNFMQNLSIFNKLKLSYSIEISTSARVHHDSSLKNHCKYNKHYIKPRIFCNWQKAVIAMKKQTQLTKQMSQEIFSITCSARILSDFSISFPSKRYYTTNNAHL